MFMYIEGGQGGQPAGCRARHARGRALPEARGQLPQGGAPARKQRPRINMGDRFDVVDRPHAPPLLEQHVQVYMSSTVNPMKAPQAPCLTPTASSTFCARSFWARFSCLKRFNRLKLLQPWLEARVNKRARAGGGGAGGGGAQCAHEDLHRHEQSPRGVPHPRHLLQLQGRRRVLRRVRPAALFSSPDVAERCDGEAMYEAAKILFNSIANFARLATCLMHLGQH